MNISSLPEEVTVTAEKQLRITDLKSRGTFKIGQYLRFSLFLFGLILIHFRIIITRVKRFQSVPLKCSTASFGEKWLQPPPITVKSCLKLRRLPCAWQYVVLIRLKNGLSWRVFIIFRVKNYGNMLFIAVFNPSLVEIPDQ